MKLKLDENLPVGGAEILRAADHDVATVAGQGLCATDDRRLIDLCRDENRLLVTLDLDFSNPLLFKPTDYSGIVVLRLPKAATHADLLAALETLIDGLSQNDVSGKLRIVRRGRIREYEPPEDSG